MARIHSAGVTLPVEGGHSGGPSGGRALQNVQCTLQSTVYSKYTPSHTCICGGGILGIIRF